MIRFEFPELFLLLVPAFLAYRRWGRTAGVTGWLRLTLLTLLVLALTGPQIDIGGRGVDVIVVADRSRSLPSEAHQRVEEIVENLHNERGRGDRVGVVTFGSQAHVEQALSAEARLVEYAKPVEPDGSDLEDAIHTALNLVDPNRPARVLVLSDGEANGPSPLTAARRAREDGVPIDFRRFERLRGGDAAIAEVELPEQLVPFERFQFTVRVHSDREVDATLVVHRDGEEFAERETRLVTGVNEFKFRDVVETGGLVTYTAELVVPNDPLPENDRGEAVVRVDAGPRLLLLNADGEKGRFGTSLEAARIPFDVAQASEQELTLDALDRYRAVVLENVPAGDLGRLRMDALAQFVEDLGGGLMLTGGQRSFGTGGYFKSPLDPILPVSMEMREEHRKTRVAIAVALDRSGSMSAPVGAGKTKMDLANLGTAEVVKLLSAGDSVAVIAVDSAPHVVQPLTDLDGGNAAPIVSKIKTIESMGGGIFVYEALVAAGRELAKAEQSTKHVILFADAADSVEEAGYKALLEKYAESGISVSVIGLGNDTDTYAPLLKDIAKRGGGNVMFTDDPNELPRLFTEDTMSVARSSFIEADPEAQPNGIPGAILPDAQLLGRLERTNLPPTDGYNLSYVKPDATLGAVSLDEYDAPWSAFWFRGLGRVAALTLEVDGPHSGRFRTWPGYDDYLVTHARWLLGGSRPDDVFPTLVRQGQEAVFTVELDSERGDPPQLVIVPPGEERAERVEPKFTWTGPNTVEARFRLDRTGTYHTLLKTGDREFVRGPAVTLPYSPEFVPRSAEEPSGPQTLQELANLTGGEERTDVVTIFADPPRSSRTVSLMPVLFALAIALLVLEIAGRRLSLWERATAPTTPEAEGLAGERVAGWLPKWLVRKRDRRRDRAAAPKKEKRKPAPPAKPAPVPSKPAIDVYAQAKERAQRRTRSP